MSTPHRDRSSEQGRSRARDGRDHRIANTNTLSPRVGSSPQSIVSSANRTRAHVERPCLSTHLYTVLEEALQESVRVNRDHSYVDKLSDHCS